MRHDADPGAGPFGSEQVVCRHEIAAPLPLSRFNNSEELGRADLERLDLEHMHD